MFGREFKGTYLSAVCRWLPAIALSLSLPISLHAQVGNFADDSPDGDAPAINAPADIATVVTPPPLKTPQLSLEQMGDRLEASGRFQAADHAYSQIVRPSASVLNKMGVAYQMLGDLKDAMRCYKSSLKLLPNPDVFNNLGSAEELLGDFSAAERDYRKALRLEPNDARVLKNLGTNLLMQGRDDKSAEAYKQALVIDPHIFDHYSGPQVVEPEGKLLGVASYMKAESCARAGLTDCALTYLQRAFNEGSATVKKVNADADFAELLGTPALARILAREQ